ncbi:hypothetical protein IB237_24345 [Agrobacterium sp. AGB01]|jgi:hypothetical protein|uniref:hypothetical protein n=1 Tax=Agrobacterium sp. AGB01 TaxID=2769302 RepID=UPI001787173D|nr:hypothetical protein [Agrobacterium sp. AGB01]MBD9390337.1 hypothetical protein [Agrobacterium sp. AGB01]
MTTTVVLGDEYDQQLRTAIMQVMLQLGAVLENRNWVVAGSQEVETFLWQLAGHEIAVEAETYMGLSISGDENTINDIAQRVSQAVQAAN